MTMNDNISAFNTGEYDMQIKNTIPGYSEIHNAIIEIVNSYFKNEISWLDIGCGTGSLICKALEHTKIKNVTLLDVSESMLESAKSRLNSYDADKQFICSNANNIDYQEKYDVVSAIQVFHYLCIDEKISSIKKCFNALKKDGIFFTCENFAPFSDIGKSITLNRWKNYQINRGKKIDDAKKHIARYGVDYFPVDIEKHLNIMRNAGFRFVEIFHLSYLQAAFFGIK